MDALIGRLGSAMLRRLKRCRSGQALVEFALVAPLFLLLLVGVFEMARAWNIYQVMSNAAREGARAAALANPLIGPDSVLSTVTRMLGTAMDPALAEIVFENVEADAGTPASVRISYPYQFLLFDALSGTGGGGLTLSTAAVMRNE